MTPKTALKSPFTAAQEATLTMWKDYYPYPNMGLSEALRAVQDWNRMISPEAAARVGEIFDLPFNRVWGVVNFFPTFTIKPTGKHRVGLCHGLSCFLKGSNKMEACLEKTLGVKKKEVTADGKFSWEPMECLGACAPAPALLVNDRLQGAATEERIAKLKDLK